MCFLCTLFIQSNEAENLVFAKKLITAKTNSTKQKQNTHVNTKWRDKSSSNQNRILFQAVDKRKRSNRQVGYFMQGKTSNPRGNLEPAQLFTTQPGSCLQLANQHRLTVVGVAAKLSISSCVSQTFPVVWSCDTPKITREHVKRGKWGWKGNRAERFVLYCYLLLVKKLSSDSANDKCKLNM